MTIKIFLITLLVASIFIETTILSFPFVLILSVLLFALTRNELTLFVIFFASFSVDVLRGSMIGITPLLVFIFLLVLTQENSFVDMKDNKFMLFLLAAVSVFYAVLLSYSIHILFFLAFFILLGIWVYFLQRKNVSS